VDEAELLGTSASNGPIVLGSWKMGMEHWWISH